MNTYVTLTHLLIFNFCSNGNTARKYNVNRQKYNEINKIQKGDSATVSPPSFFEPPSNKSPASHLRKNDDMNSFYLTVFDVRSVPPVLSCLSGSSRGAENLLISRYLQSYRRIPSRPWLSRKAIKGCMNS